MGGSSPSGWPSKRSAEAADRHRPWLIVGGLALWELVVRLGWVNPLFAASPSAVAVSAVHLLAMPEIRAALLDAVTMMLAAFGIAAAAGIALGTGLGLSRSAYRVLHPPLVVFFSVPKMIFLPLVVLIFGIGFEAKVAYGVLSAISPVVVNVTAGVRMVDRRLVLAARAMGATPLQLFRHVVVPGSVPMVGAGLWYGIKHALLGVLIGELFVSQRGVGYWITLYTAGFKTDRVLALVLALAAVAIGLGTVWRHVEDRLGRWRAVA
ncbi:MAG: ABC transporter permease subunit [Candidatus Rokubacteria bacterium]|nr:ABC transporter permease subunit [Candidatus Rokubacteria bacterium]